MPTPAFNSDDAITPIRHGYSIVDPVYFLVGLLREEWDSDNTDNIVPTIEFAEVNKNFVFGSQGDYINVYTTQTTREPVTITYGWQNEEHYFMLDFFTSGDRGHADRMVEEARRVLHAHREDTFGLRNDLPGRHWLEWGIQEEPWDRISKLFYRRSITCRVNIRFRQIV